MMNIRQKDMARTRKVDTLMINDTTNSTMNDIFSVVIMRTAPVCGLSWHSRECLQGGVLETKALHQQYRSAAGDLQ